MILNFMLYRLCKQMAIRKKYRVFLLRCTHRRFCKAKFMSRETSGNFKLWMHFTNGPRASNRGTLESKFPKPTYSRISKAPTQFKIVQLINYPATEKHSQTSINHFYSLKEKTYSNICHFSKFCIHTLKKIRN